MKGDQCVDVCDWSLGSLGFLWQGHHWSTYPCWQVVDIVIVGRGMPGGTSYHSAGCTSFAFLFPPTSVPVMYIYTIWESVLVAIDYTAQWRNGISAGLDGPLTIINS